MMCSFPHLLLGRRRNPRRKGGLSMLCGKDDLASEHALVWAAFMLFSSQPQRAYLCTTALIIRKVYEKSAIPTVIKHSLGK